MSTPAKRHCQSPPGFLESSFQKRLRKVSIEGNIGELGGAGGGSGRWGSLGGKGVRVGSTPRGWDAGGHWERGAAAGARLPAHSALRESRTRARSTAGADGEPRGQGARQSQGGAGRAREHRAPVPPGPGPGCSARWPQPARAKSRRLRSCSLALPPKLRPPRQLLKCRLLLGRLYRPGAAPLGRRISAVRSTAHPKSHSNQPPPLCELL